MSTQEAVYRFQADTSNDEFFRRFGREPDWRAYTVLDVGCGHGALALRIANAGASRVVGVDLDGYRVDFANRKAREAGVANMECLCVGVHVLHERFDYVVSKDTFEHVDDLASMLRVLRDRLEPGGEIWAGFSPLFHSPNGDHRRLTSGRVPWAHALPWPLVSRLASRRLGRQVGTLGDVGLNGLTPAQFRRAVTDAGLSVRSIRYNAGDRAGLRVFSLLRRLPGLERFCTVSIYAVLA